MLRFNAEIYRKHRSNHSTTMFCPLPDIRDLVITLRTADGVTRGNVALGGKVLCLVRGAPPSESRLRELVRRARE